jgi:hypothetical protein
MRCRLSLLVVLAAFACIGIVSGCAEDTSSTAAQETTAGGATREESDETTTQESEELEGIGDGTHRVPNDIAAGTYRSTGDGTCYWARLAGFSGELDDIAANGNNAPEIITIGKQLRPTVAATGCQSNKPLPPHQQASSVTALTRSASTSSRGRIVPTARAHATGRDCRTSAPTSMG